MITILTLSDLFLEREARKLGLNMISYAYGRADKANAEHSAQCFVSKIKEIKPNIFFFLKDPYLTPDILQGAKRASPKTKFVMWYGDQRGYAVCPLVGQRLSVLDGLLITNNDKRQKDMYQRAGIKKTFTFYHAFSPDEFQEWPIEPTYDVFFGGSNFKRKKFPLSEFRAKFVQCINKNFNLVVHGNGWKFKTEPWILRPDYAKGLRKAHVNLGINHYDVVKYYNRRLFESVASGRLHITYYIPGMEEDFVNNKHLSWFTSIQHGYDLVKYYLAHPARREAVAAEGRAFFLKRHSWPQRAKYFAELMEKIACR